VEVTNTGSVNVSDVSLAAYTQSGVNIQPTACSGSVGPIAVGASKSVTCAVTAGADSFTHRVDATARTGASTATASDSVGITVLPPASVAGMVWDDRNANGLQDGNEPPLASTLVSLYSATGRFVASQRVGASGAYRFDRLLPGDYQVHVERPSGYSFSPQNQGADDTRDSDVNPTTGLSDFFTLTTGQNRTAVDAGLYRPGAIRGEVWFDADQDAVHDAGEPGLGQVEVTLLDYSSSTALASTQTITDGSYIFSDLTPGSYNVRFSPPAGYGLSTPATGVTGRIDLSPGGVVTTASAGMYLPTVHLITDTVTVDEGVTSVSFLVQVSNRPVNGPAITVKYTTQDGSAQAGSDYVPASGTLTFAPGETSKRVFVSIIDDSLFEQGKDETFLFVLHEPVHAVLGDPASASVIITDNERPPSQPLVSPCTADVVNPSLRLGATAASRVDAWDLQTAATRVGQAPLYPQQDLDGDGIVSLAEVTALASAWSGSCDGRELAWAQDAPGGQRRVFLRWARPM